MKAHPALFGGSQGRGEGVSHKKEALLFQSTIDIHIQNAHKNTKDASISNGVSKSIARNKKMQKRTQNIRFDKKFVTSERKNLENGTFYSFSVISSFSLKKTACRQSC